MLQLRQLHMAYRHGPILILKRCRFNTNQIEIKVLWYYLQANVRARKYGWSYQCLQLFTYFDIFNSNLPEE